MRLIKSLVYIEQAFPIKRLLQGKIINFKRNDQLRPTVGTVAKGEGLNAHCVNYTAAAAANKFAHLFPPNPPDRHFRFFYILTH